MIAPLKAFEKINISLLETNYNSRVNKKAFAFWKIFLVCRFISCDVDDDDKLWSRHISVGTFCFEYTKPIRARQKAKRLILTRMCILLMCQCRHDVQIIIIIFKTIKLFLHNWVFSLIVGCTRNDEMCMCWRETDRFRC